MTLKNYCLCLLLEKSNNTEVSCTHTVAELVVLFHHSFIDILVAQIMQNISKIEQPCTQKAPINYVLMRFPQKGQKQHIEVAR